MTIRDLLSNTSGRHWDYITDYVQMVRLAADKTAFAVGLAQDAPARHRVGLQQLRRADT